MASGVTSFDFSPDGRLLAVGCSDTELIRICRCADWKLLRTLEQHENSVSDVAFSHDGSFVASASDDGIWIWKVADWEPSPVDDLKGNGLRLAFSPDGTLLAAGSEDGPTIIWRVSDLHAVSNLAETERGVSL